MGSELGCNVPQGLVLLAQQNEKVDMLLDNDGCHIRRRKKEKMIRKLSTCLKR